MLYDAAKENAKEKGLNNLQFEQIERPSTKTVQRFVNDYNLSDRKPQKVYKARTMALGDIRLILQWVVVYVFSCVWHASIILKNLI